MRKLWLVAVYEYKRNVWKKSFILMLFGLPFMIATSIGMGLWLESRQDNTPAIGIVDGAGILSGAIVPAGFQSIWEHKKVEEPSEFTAFKTDQEARAALEAGQIQVYFVLLEHYRLTRHVEVVYLEEPGETTWQQFYDILRLNLLSGQSPEVANRIVSGIHFIVRSIDGRREVPESRGPTFGLLFPLFISIAFLTMLVMGSGYMLGAVADEKETRTLEVLVTTLSPTQLVGGKLLGIIAISLTLLTTWAVVVAAGVFTCQWAGVEWFSDLYLDWRSILAIIAVSIPAYTLATILMITIGLLVTTVQEGQSISSIFFVLHFVPLYISYLFLKDPHSSLAILLSLLPFTSLMTIGMRNLFTIVPTWQILVSVLVQTMCVLGAIWLASRAFLLGMLRYGKRTTIGQLLGSD